MKAATAAGSGRSLPTARQVANVSGSGVRIAVMTAGGGYRPRFNAELVETPTAEEKVARFTQLHGSASTM